MGRKFLKLKAKYCIFAWALHVIYKIDELLVPQLTHQNISKQNNERIQVQPEQKYLLDHNLELMVCYLSGLIVAPAFQSVISTMPQTTGQNFLSKCLKIALYIRLVCE